MSDIQYSKETYNQLYNEVQRKITALLREIKPYIQLIVCHRSESKLA